MLDMLQVASRPSDMSFSVRDDAIDLEYLGGNFSGLFAQKRNALRPAFWRMIREIIRFYREYRELLETNNQAGEQALGLWLREHNYSQFFVDEHLIPMAASIWSAPAKSLLNFPARFFVRFLSNHGMIDLKDRPKWRTVSGGSQSYLSELMKPLRDKTVSNCPILASSQRPRGYWSKVHAIKIILMKLLSPPMPIKPCACGTNPAISSAISLAPFPIRETRQCCTPINAYCRNVRRPGRRGIITDQRKPAQKNNR